MSTKTLGAYGEQLAVRYLENRHYVIQERNWRCPHGELDIIASSATEWVFVEVRARFSATPITAFETITSRKKHRLITLAHYYLSVFPIASQYTWRIDVIAIAFHSQGRYSLEHAPNALNW